MKIETLKKNAFCITGPDKRFNNFRSTRIIRPSDAYTSWKWNKAYKVTFNTLTDYNEIFNYYSAYSSIPVDLVLTFLSVKYFNGKELLIRDFDSVHLYPFGRNYRDAITYEVLVKEEGKELTNVLPKEMEQWGNTKFAANTCKLLETFFRPAIESICEEYGIKVVTNGLNAQLCFKGSTDLYAFIKNALEKEVISKIRALGLELELDETIGQDLTKFAFTALLKPNKKGAIRINEKRLDKSIYSKGE